jgi:predicted Zn-dependent protease
VKALLACLSLAVVACGSPPPREAEPPKPRPRTSLETPQAEGDTGRDAAKQVEAAIGVVTDPALRAYVQAVGARLARNAPGFRYDYRFEIADEPAPNAFALPGGRIYVSRGALALTASEDELANVLGHEIAHVASRHAAAQQQVAGGGLMRTLQFESLAAYSRDLERSADRLGQGLAAVSGYDPNGMASFLVSLDRLDRLRTGAARMPGFLDSHPGTPGRAHDVAQRAGTMHWSRGAGVTSGPAEHLRRLDGLVLGGDPAQGVFDGSRFLHAGLGFTIRFPEGWQTVNTPQAVGALAPDRRMQIVLSAAGEGSDVAGAAADFEEEIRRSLHVESAGPVKVTGRDAFRLRARAGDGSLIATFIAHDGLVYQLTCMGAERRRLEALCNSATRTFRPLPPEWLAKVTGLRLALVEARAGETLAALGARSGNAWTPGETAAWNALAPDVRLAGGERVKVARAFSAGSGK